jgi:hypothetical protein
MLGNTAGAVSGVAGIAAGANERGRSLKKVNGGLSADAVEAIRTVF